MKICRYLFSPVAHLFFGLLLAVCLTACVPQNSAQNNYIEAVPDKQLPITVETPLNWQITPQKEDKSTLTLYRKKTREKVTITVKKMATDKVTPAIMKIFCRLYLKDQVEKEWKKVSFSDDTLLDGYPVLLYRFSNGPLARLLYFVEKDAHVYIINGYSTAQGIDLVEKSVIQTIRFSSVTPPGENTAAPAKASSAKPEKTEKSEKTASPPAQYSAPKDIFEIDLGKLGKAAEKLAATHTSGQDTPAEDLLALIEQYLFAASLFKSEAYIHSLPVNLEKVQEDLEHISHTSSLELPIERCKALASYLKNEPKKGTVILERVLKNTSYDLYSISYIILINPYNQQYVKSYLNTTYEKEPTNNLLGFLQYKSFLNQAKTREGKDIIRELAKKNKNNTWIQFYLAKIENSDRNDGKAKKLYERIIKKSPAFMPARYNLVLLYYKEKKYEKAEKLLKTILEVHPDDEESLLTLAVIKQQMEKYTESRAILDKILTINQYNFRALYNLGALCAKKLNDTYCARAAFSEYLIKSPQENRIKPIKTWLKDNK
ncbi:tetratricopeptide repeat protein [Desulfogranum japonicum]|uniref:tetratricopeptide repeat protein n=1 Tax=Desulfogranum japonicum TaxID=231447 RepID=UPI0003FCC83C|nr:tetratricopeptide repeat protein [Desulfogranum japonicum]